MYNLHVFIESPITSSYHVDVYQCLTEVLGSGQFVRSQVLSPYYHHIGKLVAQSLFLVHTKSILFLP